MRRTLVLATAWTASAAAAVGLGFLAVSLVDAEAATGTQQVTATGTRWTVSVPAAPGPTGPAASPAEHATVGGTVYATCPAAQPDVAGAPAPGWWVNDPGKPGQVEFENGSQKLEITAYCVDGSPYFVVEDPRAVAGDPEDGTATPTPTPPSASTASGNDSDD
jgi:hypothetical protein